MRKAFTVRRLLRPGRRWLEITFQEIGAGGEISSGVKQMKPHVERGASRRNKT